MNALRTLALMAVPAALAIAACRYTPWDTEVDCSDRYEDNLARLQAIERADPWAERFTVALIADVHDNVSDLETVVARINARSDVGFTIVLGDLTDTGLAMELEWSCKALRGLRAPRFYVLGNHDAYSFGPEIFREQFGPFDYAFSFLGTRFVIYNDNADQFPGAPDYEWMRAAAAVAPGEVRDHTIGVSHPPPIVDFHDATEVDTLQRFLLDNGFGPTVHGHRHKFELWRDGYGVEHFVDAQVASASYALMTVARGGAVTFLACRESCLPVTLPPPLPE